MSAEDVIVLASSVNLSSCLSHYPGGTDRHTDLNFGMEVMSDYRSSLKVKVIGQRSRLRSKTFCHGNFNGMFLQAQTAH